MTRTILLNQPRIFRIKVFEVFKLILLLGFSLETLVLFLKLIFEIKKSITHFWK